MTATVQWIGLDEFKHELQQIPDDLATDGGGIVSDIANVAEYQVRASYPFRSGRLQRGVNLQENINRLTARDVLRSLAPHSHLYERGTGRRQNGRGANRGVMPATPTVVPIAMRLRQQMWAQLIALVRGKGFEVST